MKLDQLRYQENAHKIIRPPLTWQNKQVTDFASFRNFIEKTRTTKNIIDSTDNNDESYWKQRCLTEPKLSEVITYSQDQVTKLLEFHIDWLDNIRKKESITRISGIWVYALLARLENPLSPHSCLLLRELAVKSCRIRGNLPEKPRRELHVPLSLIICLISKYFQQYEDV